MDALDLDLLAALHKAPRATYGQLGAAVGLSANAAKARVHRMLAEGALQGFAAIPRASILGLREGLILFTGVDDLDEREEEMLRGLAEVPGVRFTDTSLDHAVYVWLLYRDDADWERIERAAVSLVGKPPARLVRSDAGAPPRVLTSAESKVLRAMQPDGRAHVKELAARAGLTFKPLKRRLDALSRAGDVRVLPVVSPAEAAGLVLFRVVCFLAPGAAPPLVPGAIMTLEAPGVASVLAQRPTLREARELARALGAAPGVERALLQLGMRRASLAWMEDALVRATQPPAAAPPATAPSAPLPLPRTR